MTVARLAALVGLVLVSLAIGSAAANPAQGADEPRPYRVFVPGVACDGCARPAPVTPTATPTATSSPTSTLTPIPTPTAPLPPTPPSQSFSVSFIDVGQGDATLITVAGERMLIDGGRSTTLVSQRLQALGVTGVDVIVATHPDADHVAGLTNVLATYAVERIYVNGNASSTQTYAGFLAAAAAEPGATLTTASRGISIPLGGLSLDVLHPGTLSGDTNEDSIVIRLTCGTVSVLLTGDAEAASEGAMSAAGVLTDVDVLRVGHHGSRTSSSAAFLAAVRPEVAIISAGRTNQYGHPHPEVIERLTAAGATILRTDTTDADDTLTMTSDCQTYAFDR